MSDSLEAVGLVIALLSTQLVFTLYGAGVRRPFGHLPKISDVHYLWHASKAVRVADYLFSIYVRLMMLIVFRRISVFSFIFFFVHVLCFWRISQLEDKALAFFLRILGS